MSKHTITLTVNGAGVTKEVDARTLLVHFIREDLDLTGTHIGCDTTSCGACTVIVNGRTIKSCTMFAVQANGADIETIEGVANGAELHPLQEGFWEKHGLQCGYCTPGQICSAIAVIEEHAAGWPSAATDDVRPEAGPPPLTPEEIRERMSGNLCRCGAYVAIVEAVARAAADRSAAKEVAA